MRGAGAGTGEGLNYPNVPVGRNTTDCTWSFNVPIPERPGVQFIFAPPYDVAVYNVSQQLPAPLAELTLFSQPDGIDGNP